MSGQHDLADATPVLKRLKQFQLKTVNYAFRRMYEDAEPVSRFLVADEVGLGKTQVAKGLIARVVAHKAAEARRMDIIYICSNAAIASQNLSRLRLGSARTVVRASRLTLLPLALGPSADGGLDEAGVNFISFTPGTSFETKGRGGVASERVLIHRMLQGVPELDRKGLAWVLRGGLGKDWQDKFAHQQHVDTPHAGITQTFIAAVKEQKQAIKALAEVCHRHARRVSRPLDGEERAEALQHTAWLRRTLARCCLKALEPELVVLDEFQRFRDLLQKPSHEEDHETAPSASAAELAQELFNHQNQPKVLLLSATPYKMYVSQLEQEDHYKDFLATAGFLFNDVTRRDALEADLGAFRDALVGVGHGREQAGAIKQRIEAQLKQVMCRTERVGVTQGRDAMVRDVPLALSLTPGDLADYACVDALARQSGAHDVMEFWRSSPYLLNFMREDGYAFKKRMMMDARSRRALGKLLTAHPRYRILKQGTLQEYKSLVAANPRLDVLAKEMKEQGSWKLLWVPPSMPYWPGEGAYADVSRFSKTLVFSSWNMVPDAVAGLLSYHAEQLAMEGLSPKPKYTTASQQLSARLRFSSSKRGHEDMNALALMFPSRVLATVVDPLALSAAANGALTLADARTHTIACIGESIARLGLPEPVLAGPPDVRWYWLTLLMLEREEGGANAREGWGGAALLIGAGDGEEDDQARQAGQGFARHLEYWETVWKEGFNEASLQTLGPRPSDIAEVLADLALGGPAVCAFRAMLRLLPGADEVDLRLAAVKVADVLRRQLNMPEAVAIIKHEGEAVYWKQALAYCAEGNLQAMLDEYLHLLHEETQPDDGTSHAQAIADAASAAGHVRASQLHPESVKRKGDSLERNGTLSMRCRYAMRYGNATEDDKVIARKDTLQKAFNSPFRPFVLASTSVGQEGLDFHSWCHSIVHWNLPGNPVDLEQREGRVHRYKGLAVRRNVARLSGFVPRSGSGDPWQRLFEDAEEGAKGGPVEGLVPYWICEAPGGVAVERRVFQFPLSQDQLRFDRLKSSLALYRMVFAQPRQQDLLGHLQARNDAGEDIQTLLDQWRIELLPD
ncbi:helicase-related protein [Stenotrophomonas rhizophila]|uniref:helicase-related protein n=1 Tax=Stenotrophomonas rhizophila TaxID=216778 RepID=UPI0011A7F36C|nr:helicase-related protein [Stenotrophomonas rhizophila]